MLKSDLYPELDLNALAVIFYHFVRSGFVFDYQSAAAYKFFLKVRVSHVSQCRNSHSAAEGGLLQAVERALHPHTVGARLH